MARLRPSDADESGGVTKPVGRQDRLAAAVAVHVAAFPDFFMTQLGPWFLREYYRCVMEFTQGILLTEDIDGECVGFVAGFLDPALFYSKLRRRRARLALAAVAGLVARPSRVMTLLANYRRADGAARQPSSPQTAELSSLGVKPSGEGRGVGSRLVRAFVEAAAALGADRIVLTTDTHGNDAVNSFYLRHGFTRVRSFEARRRRWLNQYVLMIRKD
jgi:ribosomal protein S18 acetylase RimI-like enzyme